MVTTEKEPLRCFSCGVCIGPGYDTSIPSYAGDKPLCGHCDGQLSIDGYLQIDDHHRLLPDGSVIKQRREPL